NRGFVAQAQFQSALAVLSRMVTVRTVTARQAEYLIERLIAAKITEEGRFGGGIVRWVADDLRPAIAASEAGETLEAAFIAGVAGQASADGTSSRLTWEGQRYRLDLGFAERRRLQRVRERQEAVPIDIPIQLGTLARRLASEAAPVAEIDEAVKRLTKIAELVPKHQRLDALEIGLAPLSLRRMNFEHLTGAPKLTSNERDTFAASVAVMNPYALRDADRDAIVDAISRGRERVLALATDQGAFEAAADAVGVDGRRRRELRWTLVHDPGALLSMFSMTELLSLGGGDLRALDAWGMI